MTFTPETKAQLLENMVNYVRSRQTITDFNRGSQVRTLLESAADNDAEQNYQMVQILRDFSFRTATAKSLLRRARDYNLRKLPASPAYGEVYILDSNLERSYLVVDASAGSTSITVEDASIFTAVPPFNIRLSENAAEEEDAICTAVNTTTNVLTLSAALTDDHIGVANPILVAVQDEVSLNRARVSYVSGAADRAINTGYLVASPAIGELPSVIFTTTTAATLANGDFQSGVISCRANKVGRDGNIGPYRIIEFPSSVPFAGASVVNLDGTGGGAPEETDVEFVNRILKTINSLGGATVSAIEAAMTSVVVPSTSQRVARVSVFEEFVRDPALPGDGKVSVFIDDGSGSFNPSTEVLALGNVNGAQAAPTNPLLAIPTEGTFTDSGYILIDPDNSNGHIELCEYTGTTLGVGTIDFTLAAGTTQNHNNAETILQVDVIDENTEADRVFYRVDHIAILEPYFRLYLQTGAAITELVMFDPDVNTIASSDYFFNSGTGQLELFTAPIAGSVLFAYYQRYTGLVEIAQRTLTGDVRSPETYPGVSAAGIKALALPAERLNVDVTIALILEEGTIRAEAIERADRAVRNYINSLRVGEDVIRTEIVKQVKLVNGVYDLTISVPSANVIVDYDTIPVPGTVLIS